MKKSAGLKQDGKPFIKQSKAEKVEQFMSYKNKLRMVRCFLAWRSQARLDYSSEEDKLASKRDNLVKSQRTQSPNSDLNVIVTMEDHF
jgi:hypothetical protein